ncbi:MAG: hypothetical protein ACETWK_08985 [Candidatus Aminicenantaceae bacterium]
MSCYKVQRLLPLMLGSELSRRKIQAINAHLKKCSKCKQEYDSYVLSFERTRKLLRKNRQDWQEWEWQRAVKNALKEEPSRVYPLAPWPYKKAWAYVVMAVFTVVLALFIVRPSFIWEERESESEMISEIKKPPSGQQDIISMTIVSKETGIKIVWFFNKNFDLKEKK